MTGERSYPGSEYAYRFEYADRSAFVVYPDGRAFITFPEKDGRSRPPEQKFGKIDNRIPLLIGMAAKPRQDEIDRLSGAAGQRSAVWRSIETAPKDVPVIVLDDPMMGEAYYHADEGTWWWCNTGPGEYTGRPIFPTLWHPMPTPPMPSTDREGGK